MLIRSGQVGGQHGVLRSLAGAAPLHEERAVAEVLEERAVPFADVQIGTAHLDFVHGRLALIVDAAVPQRLLVALLDAQVQPDVLVVEIQEAKPGG